MRRLPAGTSIAVGITAAITAGVFGWGMGMGSRTASAAPTGNGSPAVSQAVPHYYLSIDTPGMLANNSTGPAYVPSTMQWPANTTIDVTILNFDDATPLSAATTSYAVARGVMGMLTIRPLDAAAPNSVAAAWHASSLDPATGVSHTFTVPGLGLSVPVAPHAATSFRFHTGFAGSYAWHCMDPCGSGVSGWGGAMAADGYMAGRVTLG